MVTGNMGYIGSILTEVLLENGYNVTGFDIDYYSDCFLYDNPLNIRQIKKDIRDIDAADLEGIDCVIHLAALSNDPLGELMPHLTEDINLHGTVRAAKLAKLAGVRRFIYASSQSMYGVSDTAGELDEDNSKKAPLTSYARTKWEAECAIKELSSDHFEVVCFRPSTVFGVSPKLRCDIVFNNLVASAYTTKKVEIKSDGTPWRPVVHVRDVSSAFLAGVKAPAELVNGESFNVGIENGNYTVRELAEAARDSVPGSELTFTGEHGSDSRTYRVSFEKILTKLKDFYKPEWDLRKGGKELVGMFEKADLKEYDFRGSKFNRLIKLKELMGLGKLDKGLRVNSNG
ncbi:MAG: SDR family oxidoreductase [Candidatus Omnitrophica bacterium]|nr:SDR family oxidoreductase [Candidatus Omnitrophota bacterium]